MTILARSSIASTAVTRINVAVDCAPNVLAVLPTLPDDIQYRFVGRHLVLVDGRSGLILDRIPFASACGG